MGGSQLVVPGITRMDGWTEQPIVVGSSRAHKAIHHGPAITTVPDPRDPGSLPALTVPVPVGGTCYRTKRMIRCHSRECRLVIGNLLCAREFRQCVSALTKLVPTARDVSR